MITTGITSDSDQPQQTVPAKLNLNFVYFISAVVAIGGLLFGYDTGVIAGALVFMEKRFTLQADMMGWVVSCAILGSILGASTAGVLSDWLGRKNILIFSAVLFSISAIATAVPNDINLFVLMRILGGFAIGISSVLCPLYISEVAPAAIRGRLVSLNQLAIVTGFLVVYFSNLCIAGFGDEAWKLEYGWRWMFGSSFIPSALFLLMLFFVPETPRWLSKQGKTEAAFDVLHKIGGKAYADNALSEIVHTVEEESGSLGQLLQPGFRRAMGIAMMLGILSQVTGINAIMYYAPIIFQKTGNGTGSALLSTVLVGAVNLLFTFVALWLIDKAGRKPLLFWGAVGMATALGGVGTLFYLGLTQGPGILLFILLFIASFAASYGAVVWVVISEIFPTRIRGRAVSIATMVIWLGTFGVSQTFPMLLSAIGPAGTFGIYFAFAVFTVFYVWTNVPETKGKTLEEIEHLWLGESHQASSIVAKAGA
ncbi:MAG: sugar porter family MFS transporter [Vampirovibrionales bacterium]|nr:sugar porter family MFS transporter [Vampirovibrionales bacterium]